MQQYTKKDELALKIIDLAKAEILTQNPFLANAVGRLLTEPAAVGKFLAEPQKQAQFTTDGERLGFDSKQVINRFSASKGKAPKHDLLHTVVHCVFLHPFVGEKINEDRWNLAADIAAERVVADILGPREDRGNALGRAFETIEADLGCRVTAERVYKGLSEGKWLGLIPLWENLFYSDEHLTWYALPDTKTGLGQGEYDQGAPYDQTNTRGHEPGSTEQRPGQGDPSKAQKEPPRQGPDFGGTEVPDEHGNGDNDSSNASQSPSEDNQSWQQKESDDGANDDSLTPQDPQGQSSDGADSQKGSGQSNNLSPNMHPSTEQNEGGGSDHQGFNNDAVSSGQTPGEGNPSVRAQGEGRGIAVDPYASERRGLELAATEAARLDALRASWSQVATSLAVNLETYAQGRRSALAGVLGDIELATEKPLDYRAFLRQFAATGEVMKLSDDEFDTVFYTYGMRLFKNMPLIEPLETREEKRIREFVIVIDTSGSVRGDIVRAFVDTTFDILRDVESFHERFNLRILQCDADVQTDDKITCQDEVKEWNRSMRIYGGGGTDFRPAFHYVDDLILNGEFKNLGGLLYFTDGWGTYPEWCPKYKTAFVFYDENHRKKNVPPWAISATLDSAAIGAARAKEPIERGVARYARGYRPSDRAGSSMASPLGKNELPDGNR